MDIHTPPLFGEKLFSFLGIDFTNTFILAILCALLLIVFFLIGFKKKEIIPGKTQNFFEFILESLFGLFDSMSGDRKKTEEIFPLVATLFIFILISNLLEILPGVGVFPFLRSPSSDLHFTLAIAIFSMGFIHFLTIKKLGGIKYLKKFIVLNNPILFFVGILEAMGEFTKTLSLGIRLFGNLFAGEILLIVITSMISFIVPLPFLGLEIFVGFIQALIFSSLITVFYGFLTTEEE
ncbi:MAG TPA: F0F1 ATP synthase subunit A [Candidatus Pacearchaeota archaeon]|nr:F0F1 ATP synthase subunit A [Candidatus Pacearchaeota archaeon]HOS12610.1 F0F1 ATP synthase subunit A [Candidatus Pacearchaeota archaeon]HPL72670.1 F0F1 ATP synthase subunit A [Candidatus Pacearchaeota archaeon]HRT18045.1 F0F1 ATP synthase subunit A [Candidatus Paceibacterota bacterium]